MFLSDEALTALIDLGADPVKLARALRLIERDMETVSGRTAPSSGAERQRRYRERRAAQGMTASEWKTKSREIQQRDGHACQYCTAPSDGVDHILPLIQGGSHDDMNLAAVCHPCNASKSGKTLSEWKGAEWAEEWMRRHRDRHSDSKRNSDAQTGQNPLPSSFLPPTPPNQPTTHPREDNTARVRVKGARMVPPLWDPRGEDLQLGFSLGFTSGEIDREIQKFRDWEFKDPKTDFHKAFRRWLRTAAEQKTRNERTSQPTKLVAKQDNYARAVAGAEIFARTGALE